RVQCAAQISTPNKNREKRADRIENTGAIIAPVFLFASGARRVPLLGGVAYRSQRVIVEDRRQPFFGLLERPLLARRVVLDLIASDLADTERVAVRMAEIEAGARGPGPHRKAFRQAHADPPLAVEQTKKGRLLGMIGLRRIAGRRANAAIFFGDEI